MLDSIVSTWPLCFIDSNYKRDSTASVCSESRTRGLGGFDSSYCINFTIFFLMVLAWCRLCLKELKRVCVLLFDFLNFRHILTF